MLASIAGAVDELLVHRFVLVCQGQHWAGQSSSHVTLVRIAARTQAEGDMRSIDIHAHLTPQCFIHAMQAGKTWHGIQPGTMRIAPRAIWNPEQRIADMNSLGVDVHVVSTGAAFYFYDGDPA